MRLLLTLAAARSPSTGATTAGDTVQALWDLAERYHPEQAWLAACWARNERTLDEIERQGPREALAPALRLLLNGPAYAQQLRRDRGFAQE